MTTVLDTKIVPKALAILEKYGMSATLVSRPNVTYDAATGDVASASDTLTSVKIAPPSPVTTRQIDAEASFQPGDAVTYIAASGLAVIPTLQMGIRIPDPDKSTSHEWVIVVRTPIYTGDEIALYELGLRR